METQILNLKEPYEYIHCNGEVGKHIATLIVYETTKGEDGSYKLESHSHPIVKYWNAPGGVVWNNVELTDCDVLCSEDKKEVDIYYFFRMVRRNWGVDNETDYLEKAKSLQNTLLDYEIKFMDLSAMPQYRGKLLIREWNHDILLEFEEKDSKIICRDNGKSQYPIYCEAETRDELLDKLADLCFEWERFTDRRVNIHVKTEQKEYEEIINQIELDRLSWDQ